MPGLVGIATLQPPFDDLVDVLSRMCQPLRHEPWYCVETHVEGPVGLGRVSLGVINAAPQPVYNAQRTQWLVLDGELYETQALRERLAARGAPVPAADDDAGLLLSLYQAFGDSFLPDLHGVFVFALWDAQARRLVIANDRFGLWPLYYAEHQGRFAFAPEVKALLALPGIPRVPNDGAIANLMYFGHLLGAETMFEGIQLLRPGSLLTWHAGQVTLRPYWDLHMPEHYWGEPEDDQLERLCQLMQQAVARRLRRDDGHAIGMLLSGGMDTRTIVAAVAPGQFHYPTFTFGTRNSYDVRFGQQVAALLGSEHHVYEPEPDFLQYHAARGVWLTDGMMVSNVFNVLRPIPQVRPHAAIIFSGDIGGWVMEIFNWNIRDLPDDVLLERLYSAYYGGGLISESRSQPVFSEPYARKVRGRPREAFRQHFRQIPVTGAINKAVYYGLRHEALRTSGNGIALLRSQMLPRLPFLDNDLVDFMLGTPPEFRSHRHLQIKALRRLAPELANVPWQLSGLSPDAPHYQVWLQRARYRLHQRASRLTRHLVPWPGDNEIMPMELWLRTTLRPWVEDLLLGRRSLERGYFSQSGLSQLVQEHMQARQDHSYALGALITFELWNRLFVDGDPVA